MEVKEKIKLHTDAYGYTSLKRWDTNDGFYIEYTSLYEYDENHTILSKGLNIIECIENLSNENFYEKKKLFAGMTDHIIEEFKLTDEEKDYLVWLEDWCAF